MSVPKARVASVGGAKSFLNPDSTSDLFADFGQANCGQNVRCNAESTKSGGTNGRTAGKLRLTQKDRSFQVARKSKAENRGGISTLTSKLNDIRNMVKTTTSTPSRSKGSFSKSYCSKFIQGTLCIHR